ncbi:ABC transporter ATP-binding protein [Hoeflea olei]|uniref:Iron ABC transporter ATP-binding protein n=1 Tax=Hoeflea olei TaxID=1480615 RepID=A0A1C1YV15_9HYPH|nr:ATP-binding cassette domain-containing protein [Hoeflea olei]OCW57382.1 iron ABC transporter ATP-binding protein [Hoeflea olei]
MIEVEGLTKRYGATAVVDDVSLRLPEGRLTAVIGPNGAGKSTLLSMIARLMKPDTGRIRVAGLDVASTAGEVLARRLSILRQENHITARLTVGDLVAFGRFPHSGGRPGPEDARHVAEALAALDLAPFRDRFLDELSGGQRQRAFVAMTLAQDADCMLFDEPLASLDIRHAISMMELLRDLCRNKGKTVVLVLHDINIAANFADGVVAMKDGRIEAVGDTGEVMTGERLSRLYGLPISVERNGGSCIVNYFRSRD